MPLYIEVMPLVGGASCGVSDWIKPRLSMRLLERNREEREVLFGVLIHKYYIAKGINH